MTLRNIMLERKAAIAKLWLDKTLGSYPKDATSFFKRERDRFANPVGHTTSAGLGALLDALCTGQDPAEVRSHLHDIIKIRSVQSLAPSQAVCFIFLLKAAIREQLADQLRDPSTVAEWMDLDAQIDQLALHAFDIHAMFREKVCEIRVDDIKRRVSGLIRRLGVEDEFD